jgi:hypothetical protein
MWSHLVVQSAAQAPDIPPLQATGVPAAGLPLADVTRRLISTVSDEATLPDSEDLFWEAHARGSAAVAAAYALTLRATANASAGSSVTPQPLIMRMSDVLSMLAAKVRYMLARRAFPYIGLLAMPTKASGSSTFHAFVSSIPSHLVSLCTPAMLKSYHAEIQ